MNRAKLPSLSKTVPFRKISTAARPKTWGSIGLGQMGYSMAKNLRTHIPPSDKFVVLDINQDMMNRFIRESESSAGAVTETAQNAREVAEKASAIITRSLD